MVLQVEIHQKTFVIIDGNRVTMCNTLTRKLVTLGNLQMFLSQTLVFRFIPWFEETSSLMEGKQHIGHHQGIMYLEVKSHGSLAFSHLTHDYLC